jgi:hypothetical protein
MGRYVRKTAAENDQTHATRVDADARQRAAQRASVEAATRDMAAFIRNRRGGRTMSGVAQPGDYPAIQAEITALLLAEGATGFLNVSILVDRLQERYPLVERAELRTIVWSEIAEGGLKMHLDRRLTGTAASAASA